MEWDMNSLDRLCFFFNDTATTEIYTLSLHDALPICGDEAALRRGRVLNAPGLQNERRRYEKPRDEGQKELFTRDILPQDRNSTRLNSSHANISYAVFCLKKKKK